MIIKKVVMPKDENGKVVDRKLTSEETREQLHLQLDPLFEGIKKIYQEKENKNSLSK